ncbi:MAG TPA: glycosyltransferase family 4 protein [Thermoanaerobaculia bacterium]|nr:glycosyltransferase family 4 protein [Thermoanaerobaculia bacterium]
MTPSTTGLLAFGVSLLLTPLLRFAAHRFDLLDRPNERSSHLRPTPRTGGVSIIAGIGVASVAAGALGDRSMSIVLAASAIVALTGFIDDLRGLHAWQKFSGQVIATTLVILSGHTLAEAMSLPLVGEISLGVFAVVGFLWIIGLTNAYNFMDGLNGIAALQAVITSMALSLALIAGADSLHRSDGLVLIALAGAALGFLPFNFPSGSIFMGDVGSGAIGFLLAAIVLRTHGVPCVVPVALFSLFPFLFDSFVTFVRRLFNREPVFSPHRSHFYQRLNILGWSHVQVTLLWGSLALVGAILALLYCRDASALVGSGLVVLFLHLGIALLITRAERARRAA